MPLYPGIPYQPYSFLIKKLDGLIIAQDDKGRIRFSGTDAAKVVQATIDALTVGKIIIMNSMEIQSEITVKPNIEIEIADDAVLSLPSGNPENLNIFSATSTIDNFSLKGGILDGGSPATYAGDPTKQNGIYLYQPTRVTIDTHVRNCGHVGVYVSGGPAANFDTIYCQLRGFAENCIRGGFSTEGCLFGDINCAVRDIGDNGAGVVIGYGAYNIVKAIVYNTTKPAASYGVYVNPGAHNKIVSIVRNVSEGVRVDGSNRNIVHVIARDIDYPVREVGGADYNMFFVTMMNATYPPEVTGANSTISSVG